MQDFIAWNKSAKVDVDSSGKPCKERLLRVVNETSGFPCPLFQNFKVLEVPSVDLKEVLTCELGKEVLDWVLSAMKP
jgi:hypothetical protein